MGIRTELLLVLFVCILDIYCNGQSNSQIPPRDYVNPWALNQNSNAKTGPDNSGSTSTTPWPELGQRRPYKNPNIANNKGPTAAPNSMLKRQDTFVISPTTSTTTNAPNRQESPVNGRKPTVVDQSTGFINSESTGNNNNNRQNTGSNQGPQNNAWLMRQNTFIVKPSVGPPSVNRPVNNPVNKPVNPANNPMNPTIANKPTINNPQGTTATPNAWLTRKDTFIINPTTPKTPAKNGGNPPPINSSTGLINSESNSSNKLTPSSTPPTNEDDELREFAEALLRKDTNNAAHLVSVNYQGRTTSSSKDDQAPQPLLSITGDINSHPTISKLTLFYNNYILDTTMNEYVTPQEKNEENALLDAMLPTAVFQHTRNFLVKKGKISKDPKQFRDLLKTIWFTMYSRGGGKIGSSGFEHVFLAEIKNDAISGLHNWIYFSDEEKKKTANYLGYLKKIDLNNKGAIVKYHFNFHGKDKPVGSMFIGTSPELEMALYSACFILRPDVPCPLKLGGNKFIIRTYTYRYRGKNMIGSAFPEI